MHFNDTDAPNKLDQVLDNVKIVREQYENKVAEREHSIWELNVHNSIGLSSPSSSRKHQKKKKNKNCATCQSSQLINCICWHFLSFFFVFDVECSCSTLIKFEFLGHITWSAQWNSVFWKSNHQLSTVTNAGQFCRLHWWWCTVTNWIRFFHSFFFDDILAKSTHSTYYSMCAVHYNMHNITELRGGFICLF